MKFRVSRLGYYLRTAAALGKYFLRKRKINLSFDRLEDLIEIKEVVIDREYHNLIGSITNKDKVVVDVGGGMGDFAIMTAVEYPRITVFTFEPDKIRFALLKKNCCANGVSNVNSYQLAITDFNQLVKIVGPKIDILKIDCEGREFDIIKSATDKQLKGAKRIVMEYHNWAGDIDEIIIKLKRLGFECSKYPRLGVSELGLLRAVL